MTRDEIRITVSTRHYWHQVTVMRIDSPELAERLEQIVRADWMRFGGHRRVEATAADNLGTVRTVVREPWPGVCPHCGHAL